MERACRRLAIAVLAVALPLVAVAQSPRAGAAAVQLQFADLLFAEGRYSEAREAYRRVVSTDESAVSVRASAGLVGSSLRLGDFRQALTEAARARETHADQPLTIAVHGDALWAAGLFDEAESAYAAALAIAPAETRALHGRARSRAAMNQLEAALADAREALRLAPRELEFHHTVGTIYERMHRYEEAAAAYTSYINLLPNRDHSEKAAWARAEVRFLGTFRNRQPVDIEASDPAIWTVPIRIDKDKVFLRVRLNGGMRDVVLDTGAEQTVVSAETARRHGIDPLGVIQSAGVGATGMRGLQVGRIDLLEVGALRVHNVPCMIKAPVLRGLPAREGDSFSPIALGLSMRVDYEHKTLTIGKALPPVAYADTLPLRVYRLALVRGTINGSLPATFVVDTGGELISISDATAGQMPPSPFRRIPLKVYGTSGWDKDAFLLPNVDLKFSSILIPRTPVVVLNLKAPSALLGVQLGGIIGHRFLSKYQVTVDLERSVVGLN
jgi:aspartyl protease/tetratricopeptide repeat protein